MISFGVYILQIYQFYGGDLVVRFDLLSQELDYLRITEKDIG